MQVYNAVYNVHILYTISCHQRLNPIKFGTYLQIWHNNLNCSVSLLNTKWVKMGFNLDDSSWEDPFFWTQIASCIAIGNFRGIKKKQTPCLEWREQTFLLEMERTRPNLKFCGSEIILHNLFFPFVETFTGGQPKSMSVAKKSQYFSTTWSVFDILCEKYQFYHRCNTLGWKRTKMKTNIISILKFSIFSERNYL